MPHPQPLDALYLVPPHDAPSKEPGLLGRHGLAVDRPGGVQQVLGILPHGLRQTVLDVCIGDTHFLNVLCLKLLVVGYILL